MKPVDAIDKWRVRDMDHGNRVDWPDIPELDKNGRAIKPVVLLLGGKNGRWQWGHVVYLLMRAAASVVLTRKIKAADLANQCSHAWSWIEQCCDQADVIGCWVGDREDVPHLEEWLWITYAMTRYPEKIVAGGLVDHVMSIPLFTMFRDLFDAHDVEAFTTFVGTIEERCRQIRRNG